MTFANFRSIIIINFFLTFLILSILFTSAIADILIIDLNLKQSGGFTINDLNNKITCLGADFHQNERYINILNNNLKANRLRLINVDLGDNQIVNDKLYAPYLDSWLDWCIKVHVNPHIIIGQGIPRWLSTYNNDPQFGPSDWIEYKYYIYKVFEHVLISRGFPGASWEVANEPDIGGAPVSSYPRSYMGSETDYQDYLKLYRAISEVAVKFESDHPWIKIILGGPACGVFTFKFGDFNWYERFLKDASSLNLKLNFLSLHFYGNISSIGGRLNLTTYPPFEEIINPIKTWISQYNQRLPLWLTEWGPSYHVDMTPAGIINGNNVGGSWAAAFIYAMLKNNLNRSFLLVNSDFSEDNWGWPALFHGSIGKPIYHVFSMFRSLVGNMIPVKGGSVSVGALAAAKNKSSIKIVLWNFNWIRGEFGGGYEGAQSENITLQVSGVPHNYKMFSVKKTLLSEDFGNPLSPTASTNPQISQYNLYRKGDPISIVFNLPASSVMLLELLPK